MALEWRGNGRRWRPAAMAVGLVLCNVVLVFNARRNTSGGGSSSSSEVALLSDVVLGCEAVRRLEQAQLVSSGWTKAVYRGLVAAGSSSAEAMAVAVKVVNVHGHDVSACVERGSDVVRCYRQAAAKILKEIVLLNQLTHPNVLKVLGYCIPSGDNEVADDVTTSGIALITELGETLDIIRLLQSSWEDRLRLTLGVTRVVYHLAHSPLGSLVMNDFRRQQFVLVGGELKLSDVDDVEFEEPTCREASDCTVRHQVADVVLEVECRGARPPRRCYGINEKNNIYRAGRHFVTFIFEHGAPASLRPLVRQVVDAYSNVSWDSERLLAAVNNIYQLYVSGDYLPPGYTHVLKGYRRVEESDLPGLYDYRCQLTLSGSGCTMTVFDEAEAAVMCDHDSDCAAFVMTSRTSWTGRRIVHFKSNVSSSPARDPHTTLFVKLP